MPLTRARATCLLLSLAAARCGGQGGFSGFSDDAVRTSAHFRYHAHAADPGVCDSTLDALEADFAAVTGFLQLSWPADARIDYYAFRSAGELTAAGICPFTGASCTRGGVVYANQPIDEHEIVHAVLARFGRSATFLEEGIAVVLSCDTTQFSPDVLATAAAIDGAKLVAWSDDPNAVLPLYAAAATLVRWLLDGSGPGAFAAGYTNVTAPGFAAADAQFTAAFGGSIDPSLQAARASLAGGQFCEEVFACSAPALALGGPATTVGDSCGVPTTYRRFALPAAQLVTLSLSGGGSAQLFSCEEHGATPSSVTVGRSAGGGGGTLIADLAAGSYYVRHTGTPVVSAAALALAVPDPGWVAAACNEAGSPYPFDDSPNELSVAVPRGSGDWTVSLAIPEPSTLYATRLGVPANDDPALAFCPSCAALAAGDPACLSASPAGSPLSAAGSYVVALPTGGSTDAFAVLEIARVPPLAPR
jgi:hypothetical protein